MPLRQSSQRRRYASKSNRAAYSRPTAAARRTGDVRSRLAGEARTSACDVTDPAAAAAAAEPEEAASGGHKSYTQDLPCGEPEPRVCGSVRTSRAYDSSSETRGEPPSPS